MSSCDLDAGLKDVLRLPLLWEMIQFDYIIFFRLNTPTSDRPRYGFDEMML